MSVLGRNAEEKGDKMLNVTPVEMDPKAMDLCGCTHCARPFQFREMLHGADYRPWAPMVILVEKVSSVEELWRNFCWECCQELPTPQARAQFVRQEVSTHSIPAENSGFDAALSERT